MKLSEIRRIWEDAAEGDEMDKCDWAIDFAEPLMNRIAALEEALKFYSSNGECCNCDDCDVGPADDALAGGGR